MPINDAGAKSDTLERVAFGDVTIEALDAADPADLDRMNFGVIGLDGSSHTQRYNLFESQQAGLAPASVMGQNFFIATGVCMNNFMVAQRFLDEPVLDALFDYVLTFRMRPTPVKLRLLQRPGARFSYILVQR